MAHYLTQTIFEGQRLDAQRLHPLQLFFVKEFQLVHGYVAVAVQIHAPRKMVKG